MAESQRKLLLTLLDERLHLGQAYREQAEKLFTAAHEYLERQRGSSPSLLGQVRPYGHPLALLMIAQTL